MQPGIATSLDALIELRFRATRLRQRARRPARAQLIGRYQSKLRGRGLDFAESRHYQPGDELRSIDWRVTARTQVTHTKLFSEEKERPMLLVLDQRQGMAFGSRTRLKSVQAAELAALLLWSSHHDGDKVGGFLWSEQQQIVHKPHASQRATLHLLSEIATLNQQLANTLLHAVKHSAEATVIESPEQPAEKTQDALSYERTSLAQTLRQIRRVAKPGTHINLITDWHDFDAACLQELAVLQKHCDIDAYRIFDQLEQKLPDENALKFSDGQHNLQLNARSSRARALYAQRAAQRGQALGSQLSALSIPLIEIDCRSDLDTLGNPDANSEAKSANHLAVNPRGTRA